MLFVAAIGLALYASQRAIVLEDRLRDTVGEMQAGLQELKASVQFDSTRQQLLLGIRDEILRVNEDISLGEAYNYAELLIAATDKYPSVDPVLLLSVGVVESRFPSERFRCSQSCRCTGPLPDLALNGSDVGGNARLDL